MSWVTALLIAAGVNVVLAAGLAYWIRTLTTDQLFAATLRQLRRDGGHLGDSAMSEITLEKQIDDTERRLEMRRERVARHVQEARAETDNRLRTGLKWAPLIVVGAIRRHGLQARDGAMPTSGRPHRRRASTSQRRQWR